MADAVSKNPTAMVDEVHCKIFCHNLTCLVQEQQALGIVPIFGKDEAEVVLQACNDRTPKVRLALRSRSNQ